MTEATAEPDFFNVDDHSMGLFRELAAGMTTRVFAGDQAMISVVSIEPGCQGAIHSHPEEQWGFLFRGNGVRTQNGKETVVNQGDFWRTPGGCEHGFRAGDQGATIFDVFAPPREAYKKPGGGFSD